MDNLGQYIRHKREQKNLTIEELSKKTLISPAVLRDIEEGKFDRYTGDEAYVKMYLKKISQVLDMDTEGVTQQYIELTKEIELEKLREVQEEHMRNEEVVEKGKNFTFKVPQLTRKPSVYEDKSHVTIIKGIIIIAIICLIVFVFWYGVSQTRNQTSDPKFEPSTQSSVEGEVETNNNNQPQDTPSNENQQNPTSEQTAVTFTRNGDFDYQFKLPEGTEKFTFKVEYNEKSWAQMKVNGKVYKQFQAKIYHNTDASEPDVVELEFNVNDFNKLVLRNGYSMGQKYYINNQEIPLTENDMSTGATNFQLTLEK